jgi:DnaJ domain
VSRDPYDVLGVPGTASEAEIRRAFRALAKRYHPDVNGGDPAAARRFVEVGSAAETLLDPRRRASYDESRAPGAPARAAAAAQKPPPPPGTARPAGTPRPASPAPAGPPLGYLPRNAVQTVAAVAAIAIITWGVIWQLAYSPKQQQSAMPANGTVVWKTAGFRLVDGWGINLAGDGARIQIVPGTSTDVEVTGGYLASAGHIAVLPPGEALTYQRCVTAVRHATSQSEPLSAIGPAYRGGLCVSGSGGDLASIGVTHDDGSSLTVSITVWEYV